MLEDVINRSDLKKNLDVIAKEEPSEKLKEISWILRQIGGYNKYIHLCQNLQEFAAEPEQKCDGRSLQFRVLKKTKKRLKKIK